MTLKTIFEKPVDRPIEGVIKADDEAGLRLEIDEYVLTREVEKRLESFLEAYNNDQAAHGVWISGFFGSGKSHLLKMLALLLENRAVEGQSVLASFLEKCGDNEFLRGELRKAAGISSKSILFNIDQKADVISKTQMDALLAVFVKVFDEMRGYYGKQGYIARFECDLDDNGQYAAFRTAFREIRGIPWETGREQVLLESEHIAAAYARATGRDPSAAVGILDKYRSDYRVSIEDFAEEVRQYVDKRDSGFRLNFFVDEVGQYIAGNVKLMTNLQTIAETLATRCRGRAWILVTAQEDMSKILGEMTREQGNDFSKIQDRFAIRMKLTSADVAEVIQKRLLMKNAEGAARLADIYEAQVNNFKTLFDFADGSQTYRNFQDVDHFTRSYPFIPYQFPLFQSAIQHLSLHNAFEGKHSSVGERSMLGVFRQVAIQIGDRPVGRLATFDSMFEGIRTALKSNIQRAVLNGEEHLANPFAVRLLKALFLVKYVKEFKATVRNLCVLMFEAFDQDLPELRKAVEEALALLEQQTYIQRTGEVYEYLTDEEKDVEQEIKNTEFEPADVADELQKMIFDHVVKNRKIRYEETGQDYPYARKLDDRLYGREHELAIHVISPLHPQAENLPVLRMQTTGRDELLVVLPPDERLLHDLLMYKKTEKYIQQNVSRGQRKTIQRILADKGIQNQERRKELQRRTEELLGKAAPLVSGTDIEIGGEEARARIVRGFQELVSRTYSNLRMLRGVRYVEKDIPKFLRYSEDGLFANDAATLDEPEREMLAFIQSNQRGGVRTTLKSLLEKFERKPYGWYFAAVLCTLAKLCGRGRVEARNDGHLLDGTALEKALPNTQTHANVVLEPQAAFTASQIRGLKEFFADFFDAPPHAGEAWALGDETAAAFQRLAERLSALVERSAEYPFLAELTKARDAVKALAGKPYAWYLTELSSRENDLLDQKERVIDPIRKFMNGRQKEIFDAARALVAAQAPNFSEIEGDEPKRVRELLADPECLKGNRVQTLKTVADQLTEKVKARVAAEIQTVRERSAALRETLRTMPEFGKLKAEQQAEILAPFDELVGGVEKETLIPVIRDRLRQFEEGQYTELLNRVLRLAAPTPGESFPKPGTETGKVSESEPRIVQGRSVAVGFDKKLLADEADVEGYLSAIRDAFLAEIRAGKRIQV